MKKIVRRYGPGREVAAIAVEVVGRGQFLVARAARAAGSSAGCRSSARTGRARWSWRSARPSGCCSGVWYQTRTSALASGSPVTAFSTKPSTHGLAVLGADDQRQIADPEIRKGHDVVRLAEPGVVAGDQEVEAGLQILRRRQFLDPFLEILGRRQVDRPGFHGRLRQQGVAARAGPSCSGR